VEVFCSLKTLESTDRYSIKHRDRSIKMGEGREGGRGGILLAHTRQV
jgi:hypothetical protein